VVAVASGKVLKPETVEKMWTAQNTSDGTKSVFGLGWGVSRWEAKATMVGMNGLEPFPSVAVSENPKSRLLCPILVLVEGRLVDADNGLKLPICEFV